MLNADFLDFLKAPFGDRSPHYITRLGTCPVRFVGDAGSVETGDGGSTGDEGSKGISKSNGMTWLRYFSGIEFSSVVKACVPDSSV